MDDVCIEDSNEEEGTHDVDGEIEAASGAHHDEMILVEVMMGGG